MANQKFNFRTYTFSLAAGVEFATGVEGDFYRIISASGPLTITFDSSNRLASQEEGMGAKLPAPYESVRLLSPTTQTVVVVLGFGYFEDSRATANVTVNTTIAPSDTVDNTGDITVGATATLLKAADVNTKEVLIAVPSDAANSIRVGNASVTATSGIEVGPGEKLSIACEAALYGIRDGSSDVDVSTLKLTRP